ncbi:MAG: PAS domain-containing protein [Phycisphaerae bacterium]|nr:PAS domain-containing protein [Phycisphaerae bacterium]
MTTARRFGIASLAVILLGFAAAYYATAMALQGRLAAGVSMRDALLMLVAGVCVLMLLVFWRGVHGSVRCIGSQLENMTRTGEIGLVMTQGRHELAGVTRPLNEFFTNVRSQIEQLRSENRELQIQSRIAAAEKHHTEAIIFSISDAVLVTNQFDEVVLANPAAEDLLGFQLRTSVRRNIDKALGDARMVRLIRETRSHGREQSRKVVEHEIEYKGVRRTFAVTLSCVVGSGNQVSGVVAVLHDVTREKEIAKMKTDFVSNVSHELKTPLASIKAYVEMLQDGEVDDEETAGEFYGIIAKESERLHRLIENILSISRIESGVIKVVKEPLSLTAVAKQVLDVATVQADAKGVTLKRKLAPVYYQVDADSDMLYQVVMNLVSNAIKYTARSGTVAVNTDVDEARGVAICEVRDTGAGIPAEDLPHIFDKFYRVRANNELAKGTGLGLTLVKHMVETVHDGRLTVTSDEGKGSTFTVELPVLR